MAENPERHPCLLSQWFSEHAQESLDWWCAKTVTVKGHRFYEVVAVQLSDDWPCYICISTAMMKINVFSESCGGPKTSASTLDLLITSDIADFCNLVMCSEFWTSNVHDHSSAWQTLWWYWWPDSLQWSVLRQNLVLSTKKEEIK